MTLPLRTVLAGLCEGQALGREGVLEFFLSNPALAVPPGRSEARAGLRLQLQGETRGLGPPCCKTTCT